MKEILDALNEGSNALIETDKLEEFLAYCMKQKDYYSFRYEYFEKHVQIILISKHTIIKIGQH